MPVHVAVIGAGVAGLVAAHRLARSGHQVTVFEASDRVGGQVRTVRVAGLPVDVGAESIPAGSPPLDGLLGDLGLADQEVVAAPSRTLVWAGRRLRQLPAGLGPAGPTRLGPVLRSRALSPVGLARAAVEPLVPRTAMPGDVGVGTFVARRFGRQVADRLVDPLLGGLHAGDVARLSLQANVPRLAQLAQEGRSVLLAHRSLASGPSGGARSGPSFVSFPGGLATFVDALAASPGVTVRTLEPVAAVVPNGGGYEVVRRDGQVDRADAVIVALPPATAGDVLGPLDPSLPGALTGVPAATVATVVAAYPAESVAGTVATSASGLLVPSTSGRLLRSAVFLGTKWPHLRHPELFLVRLSAGRARQEVLATMDDDELVARLHADLADAIGLRAEPSEVEVQRWPSGLAQLEVGHLERLSAIRATLDDHPRVALVGAGYDGLGITRCADSGARGALAVQAALAGPRPPVDR